MGRILYIVGSSSSPTIQFLTLNFEEIFQKMEPAYADIELPRMKMEFQSNLKEALQNIGITDILASHLSFCDRNK